MTTTHPTLEVQAAEMLPREIGALVLAFKAKCADLAESQIEITNEARKIGLTIQAWCKHEQLTLGFYCQHQSELPKEVTFTMLKQFVAIARKLPAKATDLTDARKVWQMDFQAAGLLELPERTTAQTKSTITPYADLVNRIGSVREVLVGWNRNQPFETWPDETRAAVRMQLAPLVELYESLAPTPAT